MLSIVSWVPAKPVATGYIAVKMVFQDHYSKVNAVADP
jgi:hypothetical protein